MARLKSPVKAPVASGRANCGPAGIPASMHAARSSAVGKTAISTSFRARYGESLVSQPAGAGFIFQLAAMTFFRINALSDARTLLQNNDPSLMILPPVFQDFDLIVVCSEEIM